MQAIDVIAGKAYPLGRDNIDTDLILPGRFLKTITRTGLGIAAFESIRAEPGNVLGNPSFKDAPILIAGANFGCGSSREHAVWAMMEFGIKAVIGESFSDIFAGNAFKNGLLTIALPAHSLQTSLDHAINGTFLIDLADQRIQLHDSLSIAFDITAFQKDCLLRGLDEIALTLLLADNIAAFESKREAGNSWLGIPAQPSTAVDPAQ